MIANWRLSRKSRGILGWTGQWEFILKPWKSCTRDLKIDQQNDYNTSTCSEISSIVPYIVLLEQTWPKTFQNKFRMWKLLWTGWTKWRSLIVRLVLSSRTLCLNGLSLISEKILLIMLQKFERFQRHFHKYCYIKMFLSNPC